MNQQQIDAVDGKIPFDDLTDEELSELEELIFQAIANKKGAVSASERIQ